MKNIESFNRTNLSSSSTKVAQLSVEIATHNWGVIQSYGSTGQKVLKAFLRSGYSLDDMETLIPRVMDDLGYGSKKIAHRRGGRGSGLNQKTQPLINSYADGLVGWAIANRKNE